MGSVFHTGSYTFNTMSHPWSSVPPTISACLVISREATIESYCFGFVSALIPLHCFGWHKTLMMQLYALLCVHFCQNRHMVMQFHLGWGRRLNDRPLGPLWTDASSAKSCVLDDPTQAWTGHCAIVPSTNTGAPWRLRIFWRVRYGEKLRLRNFINYW